MNIVGHNFYIQLLAETGLIGFSFLLFAFLALTYYSIKQFISLFRKNSYFALTDYQVCLLACILITLWPIAPSLDFFNNWINAIYYLPLGFLLNSFTLKESKD